jgi:hypothetical protein
MRAVTTLAGHDATLSTPAAGRYSPAMTTISAVSTPDGRVAFILGGSLLSASSFVAIVTWIAPPAAEATVRVLGVRIVILALVGATLFAAALIVFAFGVRGKGSVVGRRPGGVLVLVALGLSHLVFWIGFAALTAANAGMGGSVILIIPITAPILAIIAGVSIVRARAVPGRWRWAPLIASVFYALAVVARLVQMGSPGLIPSANEVLAWVTQGSQLLLGIVAVWMGIAERRRTELVDAALPPAGVPPAAPDSDGVPSPISEPRAT